MRCECLWIHWKKKSELRCRSKASFDKEPIHDSTALTLKRKAMKSEWKLGESKKKKQNDRAKLTLTHFGLAKSGGKRSKPTKSLFLFLCRTLAIGKCDRTQRRSVDIWQRNSKLSQVNSRHCFVLEKLWGCHRWLRVIFLRWRTLGSSVASPKSFCVFRTFRQLSWTVWIPWNFAANPKTTFATLIATVISKNWFSSLPWRICLSAFKFESSHRFSLSFVPLNPHLKVMKTFLIARKFTQRVVLGASPRSS